MEPPKTCCSALNWCLACPVGINAPSMGVARHMACHRVVEKLRAPPGPSVAGSVQRQRMGLFLMRQAAPPMRNRVFPVRVPMHAMRSLMELSDHESSISRRYSRPPNENGAFSFGSLKMMLRSHHSETDSSERNSVIGASRARSVARCSRVTIFQCPAWEVSRAISFSCRQQAAVSLSMQARDHAD